MTREIKFRAWKWKKMEYFDLPRLYWRGEELGEYDFPEKGTPVMQFTGLKDKNGKEIYEGDIVQYEFSPASKSKSLVGSVEYDRAGFGFQQEDGFVHFSVFNRIGELEVLGNIYENPELLK